MTYIIKTSVSGVPYYVRIFGTVVAIRGLKDHATNFDTPESAHHWRRVCEAQKPNLIFKVVDKNRSND